ncbi:MAG TPA: S8 family serine peptidase [Frankiaceae bacterium]|nr:S8 family serine peptidase [Frankiaceae bacterium]
MKSFPRTCALTTAVALAAVTLLTAPAASADDPSLRGRTNDAAVDATSTYDRFIVHFTVGAPAALDDTAARAELTAAGVAAGHRLGFVRRIATGGVLFSTDARLDAAASRALMATVAARPGVGYVEPDAVMRSLLTPNDTHYGVQWHYHEATAGMNLPAAWDNATGTGQVVAVVDTGITTHSDLSANILAGYDFISSATAARDGNGRDSNAADQGDWWAAGECGLPYGSNSSWHGTHVAGTVAAVSNNAKGVAGVAFNAKVVPVRVLGKCGGTLSDIADGVIWAAGGTVTGVPANANPAKVVNMSLGGGGTCGATYQNAINAAVSRGATVVVAAGNENVNASGSQPANCANVVTVAALDRTGNRASYSNYGTVVDVSAPGGELDVAAANGIASTLNSGTTTPTTEAYVYYEGTSMATPHVAGLVALMLSKKSMTPADVEATLKANVRAIPGTCSGGCGAGLVDAAKTITAVMGGGTSPSLFTNSNNYTISDNATVESPISVSRTGLAPSTLKVPVDIKHTFRGDLVIDLVAPDGSLYRLKNSSSSDSADNVLATYTVNASTETASGTWKLRVQDIYSGDTGYIDSWSLQF